MKKFQYINEIIKVNKLIITSDFSIQKTSIMEQIAEKLTEFSENGFECVQIDLSSINIISEKFTEYNKGYVDNLNLKINVILKKEIIEN